MNKRGQFFLIAALVIVLLIAGLATVYNYAIATRQDVAVFDLSKEMNFEASQVLDSGVLNNLSMPEVAAKIQNLTDHYSQTNPNSNFIVIFGNETSLNVTQYKNTETGSVSLSTGGGAITKSIEFKDHSELFAEYVPTDNLIEIRLSNDEIYRFELRPGQTLYIIVKKETAGGKTVVSPESAVYSPIESPQKT